MGCIQNHTFHNWAQTITCKPELYCQPESESKAVQIVKQAIAEKKRVRTVGAGHSWAPLALTKDILVNLDKMTTVEADVQNRKARVQAGIRLKNLIPKLRKVKMGLANLGSITEQSIAGAISTGTHGTGLKISNIGTQIIGMKLIAGTGDVINITQAATDVLNAARLSLGALGIISEVTIQCVDDYQLELAAYWYKFDEIVDQMETLAKENTRVKFWWLIPPMGVKDNVIMSTENPIPGATGSTSAAPHLPMDAMGLLDDFFHPPTTTAAGRQPFFKYTGKYDEVLTIPLFPILHRECEYAIPLGATAEVLRAFKRIVDEGNLFLTLPVEVRFVAKDETLLSPAYKQDVVYIGVATQPNANEVIERFEPIVKRLGGKPHWGKCFSLTRAEAEAAYPAYQKFREIRNQLDPDRIFSNEFLKYYFD
jgi:FAD/FMN-containing dehydrogenase